MSQGNSDRNLLIGILAMQMDFVSRDQLVEAMHAWVLDKSQSLDDVLLRQEAIDKDIRDLIRTLVEKHLQMHQGDAGQSLVAVSSVGSSVREQLRSIGDADVEASLSRTLASAATDKDQSNVATIDVGAPSGEGLRFRILRPHARGGLGQVSVALDQELHREVALKEIQDQHADNADSRSRFVMEAEVTGGLEHPGVVPVYALGTYADGRPFYAMRFIRGDSFKEAIDRYYSANEKPNRDAAQQVLELRNLLDRFIDVCNAIEYAHSRGILHRDIKPSNIMLGKYGETLVVDWGLAKVVGHPDSKSTSDPTLRPASDHGSTPTQEGSAVGTPAFMSPEQAEGQLERLGPASDVYSLGASLYYLLTGSPPVDGPDNGAVLARVRRGEIPSPRSRRPEVPKPLEAVCMKALALSPADRYLTVRALAEDVERWLADEPVLAMREPWYGRLARWTRKHRAWTLAAAASLLVIAAVSVVAALLINDARRAKGLALNRAEEALAAEQRARSEADQERARANANFAAARRAVDEYYTEVSENTLLKRQGSEDLRELRKALLEHALRYYESFSKQAGDNAEFRTELADAYQRASSIRWEIGNTERALEAALEALAIRRELVRKQPNSLERMEELAEGLNVVAMLRRATGRVDEVIPSVRESVAITQRMVDANPDETKHRERLARRLNSLAVHLNDQGRVPEAESNLQQAIGVYQQLLEERPDDLDLRDSLAGLWLNHGQWKTSAGEVEEGIRLLEKARDFYEKMAQADPANANYQLALAVVEGNIGLSYRQLEQTEKSLARTQSGLQRIRALAALHPTVLMYRSLLAKSLDNVGDLQLSLGRAEEALGTYEEARDLFAELCRDNPTVMEYRRDVANNHDLIGHALLELGRADEALGAFERSRDAYLPLISDIPSNHNYRSALLHALGHLSQLYPRLGQFDKAIIALRESLEQLEFLAEQRPGESQFDGKIIMALGQLADTLRLNGQSAEAVPEYRKLLAALEEKSGAFPESTLRALRANTLNTLGKVFNDMSRYEEGLEVYRQALQLNELLTQENPDDLYHATSLGTSRYNVGNSLRDLDRSAEALTSYRAACDVFERIVNKDSEQIQARALLGATLNNMGNVLAASDRLDDAEQALRKAIGHQELALAADPVNPEYRAYLNNHRASLAAVLSKKEQQ